MAEKLIVVAIGGGTGLSSLLRGIKAFDDIAIHAVVTITDEGGSSGKIREELKIPPPGDVRNNLVALARNETLLSKLFDFRFQTDGTLQGHSVGNIILAALTKILGSFSEAVKESSKILAIKGEVLPVTNELVRLVAEMEDGSEIIGETEIVKSKSRIKKIRLSHEVKALPEVIEIIKMADGIIIGPGSLYTSLISNLLIKGVKESIIENKKAIKIYIANIMTQPGETIGYTLSDHVNEIIKYMGCKVDYVIANSQKLPDEDLKRYRLQGSEQVELDIERIDIPVFAEPLLKMEIDPRDGLRKARHDSEKLGKLVKRLLRW